VTGWRFHHIGLIVTGKGEAEFLPEFLRALCLGGRCTFTVLRRINQRPPLGEEKVLKMGRAGKRIPDKDEEEIGLPARRYIRERPDRLVLVVDDVERRRVEQHAAVFQRYRDALDTLLGDQRDRAAVHFLRNMLEAYYFAHAEAVNAVRPGTLDGDHEGDVELIPHPKNELGRRWKGFDEVEDGKAIVSLLDLEHVLSRAETCGSLRALVDWCTRAIGEDLDQRFSLLDGLRCAVTHGQPVPSWP
jgi:hypothetical protein